MSSELEAGELMPAQRGVTGSSLIELTLPCLSTRSKAQRICLQSLVTSCDSAQVSGSGLFRQTLIQPHLQQANPKAQEASLYRFRQA